MNSTNTSRLEQRVVKAAEAALQDQKYVSPIDVLVGIGWLPPSTVAAWRLGRLPYLERGLTVNLHKTSTAMHVFRSWAVRHGLEPSEAAYVAAYPRPPAPAIQRQRAGDDRAQLPNPLGLANALREEAGAAR